MDAALMRQLATAAGNLTTKNHERYLSEALQALKRGPTEEEGGALAALALLSALQGSAYATRKDEKHALAAVGGWLEQRLTQAPAIAVEDLARELGWLKRLASAEGALQQGAPPTPTSAPKPFGQSLPKLKLERKQRLARGKR